MLCLFIKHKKENMESEKCVKNMLSAIRTLGLHDFVRDFDHEEGFMWSNDKRIYDIGDKVISDGHSGASFACCLRQCQQLLKTNPYDAVGVDSEYDANANANALEPETKSEYIEGTDVKNGTGEDYVFYEGMDTYNKQAMDIAVSKGMDAAVEFMTKGLSDGTSCYAAMRERYG